MHHVRPATNCDLAYLDYLQARNRAAVGFLPWTALQQYLAKERVLIVEENDEPAGYFLTLPTGKIVQAVVTYDARRRYLATLLLTRFLSQLSWARTSYASCWCADDLDANAFWKESGFLHEASRELRWAGRIRRMQRHWIRRVNRLGSPDLPLPTSP